VEFSPRRRAPSDTLYKKIKIKSQSSKSNNLISNNKIKKIIKKKFRLP
jgi:hypothetical protein